MKRSFAILTALMLVLSLCGFALAEESTLAGTYVLDATPLGMPLSVYLFIDENNDFQLSNKLVDGADKGKGSIGEADGLYVMLYADSTADAMKTATFTLDGVNLVFSTSVPYGAANFSPNTEDEANVIWPVAKKIIYTEYLGEYAGSLAVEAMGSAITYNAAVTLKNGAEYEMISTFDMGGTTYDYAQSGTFSIVDGQITLTCEGKAPQTGTISGDGITAGLFLSAMASSPREITLRKAITAEYAGTYTGVKDMTAMMGFLVDATLTLDAFAGYTYTARIEGEPDYTVAGTYTADGTTLTLTPAEGNTVTCALSNMTLTAKLPISASVPMATEIVFYSDAVQGVFTAAGTDDLGSAVSSVLTLNADGTYTIAVTVDGMLNYEEAGSFALEASMMGVSLVLTATDGTVSTGVVSSTININHNVDNMFNTLGFKYAK